MVEEGKILYFTDLEGTLLRESDGNYDDECMFLLLEQLLELEKLTNSKIHMHIVSPIYIEDMEKMVSRIDKNISSFNHIKKSYIKPIEGAVASFHNQQFMEEDYRYDRIIPFPEVIDQNNPDTGRYGKSDYVKKWISLYQERNLKLSIYSGNGRNDIMAMENIKKLGKKGLVLCPNNSRAEVKKLANVVSEKSDIKGIIEGFSSITKQFKPEEKSVSTNDMYL